MLLFFLLLLTLELMHSHGRIQLREASRHMNYGAPLVVWTLKSRRQFLAYHEGLANQLSGESIENGLASVPIGSSQVEVLPRLMCYAHRD